MYSPDGHVVIAVAGYTGRWRVRVRTKCAALFVGIGVMKAEKGTLTAYVRAFFDAAFLAIVFFFLAIAPLGNTGRVMPWSRRAFVSLSRCC